MKHKEIWKPISGYGDKYFISSLGRVKNIDYRGTGRTRILEGKMTANGYIQVKLTNNKVSKTFFVHRLVAQYFVPNTYGKSCVNHIDCNRLNNEYSNLEWVTRAENVEYMDSLGRRNRERILSVDDVLDIRNDKSSGMNYKESWSKYSDKITLSGFQKVWYNQSWRLNGEDV